MYVSYWIDHMSSKVFVETEEAQEFLRVCKQITTLIRDLCWSYCHVLALFCLVLYPIFCVHDMK